MNSKHSDTLFNEKINKNFEFDENVARVFDDMLVRSVPFYEETLRLCTNLCINNTQENDIIYDVGCSTANTLINISLNTKHKLNLIGIDSSSAMLKIASEKIKAYEYNISLIEDNVFDVELKKSKIILSNYTLQFIRPMLRDKLLSIFYDSLSNGGIFICSEKLITTDSHLNNQLIDEYLSFKKNKGYNKTQIMQKRQALENVLIPYTMQENIDMLQKAGFVDVDIIFRWANFATFFARKQEVK